jgi:chaperone modulatory protein CbpM
VIAMQEFLVRARVGQQSLQAWIRAGWLIPPQTEPEIAFSDVDLARAQLIRDLRDDFGVNDEGIEVILHLLDQMHGLRATMQELLGEMHGSVKPKARSKSSRRPR